MRLKRDKERSWLDRIPRSPLLPRLEVGSSMAISGEARDVRPIERRARSEKGRVGLGEYGKWGERRGALPL